VYGHTIEQFRAGSIAVICCKCIPAPIADGQSLEVAKSSAIVVVSCSFSGLASSVLSRLVASGSECLFIGWRTQEFWIGGERCSESSFSIRLAELG
jgi:hypothetical protein